MFPDLLCDDVFRLETPRLWLRWPRAADAAAIARLAGDADVARMTAQIPHPYPDGAAAEFILLARSGNARGESLTLALSKKRGQSEAIGCVGLRPLDDGALELGYWLGKSCWGRGLMTEAVREVVDMTFRYTEAPEIRASAMIGNPASRRVLETCGFSLIGQGLTPAPARGGPQPSNLFGFTREAWIDRGYVRARRPARSGDCAAPC